MSENSKPNLLIGFISSVLMFVIVIIYGCTHKVYWSAKSALMNPNFKPKHVQLVILECPPVLKLNHNYSSGELKQWQEHVRNAQLRKSPIGQVEDLYLYPVCQCDKCVSYQSSTPYPPFKYMWVRQFNDGDELRIPLLGVFPTLRSANEWAKKNHFVSKDFEKFKMIQYSEEGIAVELPVWSSTKVWGGSFYLSANIRIFTKKYLIQQDFMDGRNRAYPIAEHQALHQLMQQIVEK